MAYSALGIAAAAGTRNGVAQGTTYSAPTFSDWGGTGLWQTPTARMAPAGEVAFTTSHVTPYTRYNFLLQPFSWFEAVFRYSDINNRPYGAPSLSGNQTYKDKSIDVRVRLWRETRYRPALAVGIRDIAGTGLFSGEYVVASKRFGPIDASLGLGWGYVGARGDMSNPFDIFSNKFRTRPKPLPNNGGEFSATYFRGRTALFGGASWQTPIQRLIVKLEYDGNNYQHEPLDNNQKQNSPWNIGVVYRVNSNVDLSAAFERGNTAMFSLSLHTNLAHMGHMAKPLDPPPPPPPQQSPATAANAVDWPTVAQELKQNAGIDVSKIAQRGRELVVTGDPNRYYFRAQSLGRMARVLDQYLGPGIDWYSLDATRDGMPVVESSVDRARFEAFTDHRIGLGELSRAVELDQPLPESETVLYRAQRPSPYHGGFALGYTQSVGGPNAFILYAVSANYDATYHFTPGVWWSGDFSADLVNNYNKFTYTAPSNLPRVRTLIRQYLTSSRVTMPVFQLSAARRLAPDWYGMAYGGMLEMMYGGVGGEVLYRPFGERWAIGADVNWLKQRGFNQGFSFRPYNITTGFVTGYFNTNFHHTLLKISAGRYLAGDWGTTIDLSRHFRNGTCIGAYATFTTADGRQFGEGSFDKGIYISIPFDLMLPRSSQSMAHILWEPLLRDGGARLDRAYTLYQLTQDRDGDNFYDHLDRIAQ